MRHIVKSALASGVMIVGLAFSSSAVVAGTLYDCTVKQTAGARGWISPRVAIVVDDAGGAQIIDSITLQFETGPRPANVRRTGDTLKLNWSFSSLTDRANQIIPKFSFTGTLNTKTGAFKIRAKPARFPQTMRGNGTCTARKNLTPKQLNRVLRG